MATKKWASARIGKQYSFSAAHFLTGVSKNHPCARMHGHNYMVEVEVRGEVSPRTGMIIDFWEIDQAFKPLVEKLDHQLLNDFLENPTAERLAAWFMKECPLKIFFSVTVWETPKCYARVVNGAGLYAPGERIE